jgi:hypothetical protein
MMDELELCNQTDQCGQWCGSEDAKVAWKRLEEIGRLRNDQVDTMDEVVTRE